MRVQDNIVNRNNSAKNNRNEVRKLVENAIDGGHGHYLIKDLADNYIYVNTNLGYTALVIDALDENGNIVKEKKWYENGETSAKRNGYVYTPLYVNNLDGKLTQILYGTHSLVAMLRYKDEYDVIDKKGGTPICNHMDNKPWNNRADNLEWTTTFENIRHGKLIASFRHHFPMETIHVENNLSDSDFIVLDHKLSTKTIKEYLEYIGNKEEFKCEKDKLIEADVLETFLSWLMRNKKWGVKEYA